jgi:hypothetical protein
MEISLEKPQLVYAKNSEEEDTPPGPIIFSKLEDVASFTGTPWTAGSGLGSYHDEKRATATCKASPPEVSSDFAQWEEDRRRLISLVERTKRDADAEKDDCTQAARRSGAQVFADRKVEKHPRMQESGTQLGYKKSLGEEWSSRRQERGRAAAEGSQSWARATPVKRRLDFADFAVVEASNNPGTDEMSFALESCSA